MSIVPKFTVVIPAFNAELTINESIQSVLNQQSSVDQIIVIDDGSTDNTGEIVKNLQLQSSVIEYVRQDNRGVSLARNKGLNLAKHENIFFLDSDDIWLPNKVKLHSSHLKIHPNCQGSFTNFILFNESIGCFVTANPYVNRKTLNSMNLSLDNARVNGSCSSFLGNRSALLEIDGFEKSLTFGEDLDLWVRYAKKQDICDLESVGVAIRTNNTKVINQTSANDLEISRLYFYIWAKNGIRIDKKNLRTSARKILRADLRRIRFKPRKLFIEYPKLLINLNEKLFREIYGNQIYFYFRLFTDITFEFQKLITLMVRKLSLN